jgi:hypothetical protein
MIWAIFLIKNMPKGKKMRPNGEISPNLVTLHEFLLLESSEKDDTAPFKTSLN